jgi:hypothetical protein
MRSGKTKRVIPLTLVSGPRAPYRIPKVCNVHLARILLLFLPIALCSCAAPAVRMNSDSSLKSRTFAWDGSGLDPNRPRAKVKRVRVLADEDSANQKRQEVFSSLRPYSAAWWAVRDEIEADHDKRLARKLVICSGCLHGPPLDDVATGTITAN